MAARHERCGMRGLIAFLLALALMIGIGAASGVVGTLFFETPALAQRVTGAPANTLGTDSRSDMWREVRRGIAGDVSLPNKQAGTLVQSEGELWRAWHNGPLSVYGGWVLLGVIVVLAVFFALRGRIRVESGWSGRLIERFSGIERFSHWLTAVSFVLLALTGLNMLYGRYVLMPLIGLTAFSALTRAGKYTHDYLAFAFMLGIVLMFVLWVRENIPDRYDLKWLAYGGGFFTRSRHPPARKFNAGQKLLFWLVILGGVSVSLSGLALLFPFTFSWFSETFSALNVFGAGLPTDLTPLQETQLSQLWHAVVGLLLIALIIGHIYIGTLGMEGAFSAMGSGKVDENWAAEHHSVWAAEVAKEPVGSDD